MLPSNPLPSIWPVTPSVSQFLSMEGFDHGLTLITRSSWVHYKGTARLYKIIKQAERNEICRNIASTAIAAYNRIHHTHVSWDEISGMKTDYVFSPAGETVALLKLHPSEPIDLAEIVGRCEEQHPHFDRDSMCCMERDLRSQLDVLEWCIFWHTSSDILTVYRSPYTGKMARSLDSRTAEEIGSHPCFLEDCTEEEVEAYVLPIELIDAIHEDTNEDIQKITQGVDEIIYGEIDYTRPVIVQNKRITYYTRRG